MDSIEGCFDEVILVDTGSIDSTKDLALKRGCKVFDFEWVSDFAKARNVSFEKASSDYLMWMDLDDVLSSRESFIHWRDHVMEFAEMFFASYNYALDKDGKPIVSFVRERVLKRSLSPTWQYPIHEGIVIKNEWAKDYALTWTVNHMRDHDDIQADKSRNINIFEKSMETGKLNPRMQFYYGKELFEAGRPFEAIAAFEKAVSEPGLEPHDRLLSYQYGAYSAMAASDKMRDELTEDKKKYLQKSLEFSTKGIAISPNRAELQVAAGDSYLKMGNLVDAIPYYAAAKQCVNPKTQGSPYEGAIYSFVDCYGLNPSLNLSKIYFNLAKVDEAEAEAQYAFDKFKSVDAKKILDEISRIKKVTTLDNNQTEVDDIIITCPPQSAYEFDEELYKSKGMGGSETALIQMAKLLKEKTKRPVKVFNMRSSDLLAESGVEYISNAKMNEYLSKSKPRAHIAWRHNIRLTRAPTYLWCHDLVTATVESQKNFDKMFCLTPFHKNYVMAKQGVPGEKIIVTRNGIDPAKLSFPRPEKDPHKLLWMSSPDRGLDRAMLVCDEVIKEIPEIKLHVYYGLENLYKYGLQDLAEKLKAMMSARPYVIFHGFTEQAQMYKDCADGAVWVHPCNFIETFCITALEMLELGVFPVTRRLGGLKDTLAEAEAHWMAVMLDHDCVTKEEIDAYAYEVRSAIREEKWKRIGFDGQKHSWEKIADEWILEMGL